MTGAAIGLLGLLLALVPVLVGGAAPTGGQLDPSFSTDGKRTVTFGSGVTGDIVNGLAMGPGGRIAMVGSTSDGGANRWAIAVFKPNGGLDHSFSGDGKRTIGFGGTSTIDANGVAIQANGRIVVSGEAEDKFAVARVMPNGNLDHSFSSDGKRTVAVGDFSGAEEVSVDANGKIVVAGTAEQSGGPNLFAVLRLLSNGSPDTSFSGDGKRTLGFGGTGAEGDGLAIQGDGKIIVAGASFAGDSYYAVARLNPGGGLDDGFSGDGKRVVKPGPGIEGEGNVAAIRGGRIVVAGDAETTNTNADCGAVVFKSDGNLDTGFSGDGRRVVGFGPGGGASDSCEGLGIDSQGRIVLGGFTDQGSGSDFAVARIKPGGGLDQTFSGDGRRAISFNNGTNGDNGKAVGIPGGGTILIGGYSEQPTTGSDFAIARLLGG
jgi:uncharacterized delta-60 repeat protein